MNKEKSHWILGLVYINPDDPQLLVPIPCKLGLAVNFGNPRSVRFLAWIWLAALLGFFLAPIVAHPSYFTANPTPLFWVLLAILGALSIIRLNGCFAWSDYRLIHLASFGLVATGVGFGFQALINGPLVVWWGADSLSWAHHLVLAPVAALGQTFGKAAAVLLLLRAKPASHSRDFIRYGLLIGLGFTIIEITSLYFSVAWAELPLRSYLGVWERLSSSMFHIYSGALVALALRTRRYLPLLVVLAIHTVTDYLAGIHNSLPLSIYVVETIFSACAVLTWVIFLLMARPEASEDL